MKVGLVLEGGAMRGLYTSAILDSLLDTEIKIDGMIGVSAGALFGVNYKSQQKGRGLRYNKKYIKNPFYMGLGALLKTGEIVNRKFAYHEIPLKLDVFDEETYSKTPTDFYCVVTNIETGKPEYRKIINATIQVDELRASGSMPFVSKPVKIDTNHYLDGALGDSIPLEKMLEMGYDKIIVVLTRPSDYRKKKRSDLPAKIVYKKYPNLVEAINTRATKYNKTLDLIKELEKDNKIFVLRPSKELHLKRIEKNLEKMQAMYDLGIQDFKDNLKKLNDYLKK